MIDPAIEGIEYDPITREYGERDAILYALAVGATELEHVYERDLQVLPTFPVVLPFEALMQMEDKLGIPLEAVLHGEQRLQLHRPIPPRGRAVSRARVERVWDKGAGAVVDTIAEVEVDGELVATATYASFVRGGGGFGGERGSGLKPPGADGAPDATITQRTLDSQAQLYRLCGDSNPLHIDPAFAQRAGFDQPILHGLCTYGFAVRMAMGAIGRVAAADARFTGVVFPGDELAVEVWRVDAGSAYARVLVPARDAVVIDPLLLTLETSTSDRNK